MKAGYNKAEITPPLGVELAGYGYYLNRRCVGVDDPLYARAVAFEDEKKRRYLIISCDVLGLSGSIADDVFDRAEKELEISRGHIMLVSIHTHTGPALKYHEGCGYTDSGVVSSMAEKIFRVCRDAVTDLKNVAGLSFSMETLTEAIAYNRACAEGPVDDKVRAFRVEREDAPSVTLISYACHAVSRGHSAYISADYPGEVCRLLEENGTLPVYINGLCGDIDPARCQENETIPQRIKRMGQRITEVLSFKPLRCTVDGGRVRAELHLMQVTEEKILKTAEKSMAGEEGIPGAHKITAIWKEEMLKKLSTLSDKEEISVSYLRLGGVPVVAFPFEGFTEMGSILRRTLKDDRCLALGCAEELLGYLPTRDDIARGAYAALESTFLYKRLPILPGEAERLGALIGAELLKTV